MPSEFHHDTFMAELQQAGLGDLPMVIAETGEIAFHADMSAEQLSAVGALREAHDGLRGRLRLYARDVAEETAPLAIHAEGVHVPMDWVSQTERWALMVYAAHHPEASYPWLQCDGSTVEVDATRMMAIGEAVGAHLYHRARVRAEVSAGIEDGSITSEAEIDAHYADDFHDVVVSPATDRGAPAADTVQPAADTVRPVADTVQSAAAKPVGEVSHGG